jgi:hypothetical protein
VSLERALEHFQPDGDRDAGPVQPACHLELGEVVVVAVVRLANVHGAHLRRARYHRVE